VLVAVSAILQPKFQACIYLQGKPYNEKVDIFSFGVSAVEIMTGSKPELHTDSGLTVDTRFPCDMPKLVQLLLHACLSIDPDQRPTADLVLLCLRASRSSGNDTLLLNMVHHSCQVHECKIFGSVLGALWVAAYCFML